MLSGERRDPPPLWLMRQAGRYLPEYRELRTRAESFLDLCLDPKAAAEITLQPVRRFDFDAAILFSDILIVPYALGQAVSFVEGHGPQLGRLDPAMSIEGVEDRFAPVVETVRRVRAALPPEKALIGFCGAPWTVATYMVAGHTTPDQAPARLMAARRPDTFQGLIDRLVEVSAKYLIAQLHAGAEVVQIFDSWAGTLNETDFERWCIAPTSRLVNQVRAVVPGARIIGFPKAIGLRLERYVAATGVDGIGIDWTVPLAYAAETLAPRVALQGNLDPIVLVAGGAALDRAVDDILARLGGARLIFNLGHGIRPETPIENVARLVRRVRGGR